jgi:hypothetical protein
MQPHSGPASAVPIATTDVTSVAALCWPRAWRTTQARCLDRRIADKQILAHEVTAWQDHRNKHHAKADWQFTTANARVKLKRLYPQFE